MGSGSTKLQRSGFKDGKNTPATEAPSKQNHVNKVPYGPKKTTKEFLQNIEEQTKTVEASNEQNSEEPSINSEEILASRGFTDSNLIHHSSKTPTCLETFIFLFEALEHLREMIAQGDWTKPGEFIPKASFINSCYSKQKSRSRKIALGNFLADSGFANVAKEICVKLWTVYPRLFSYDRETDPTTNASNIDRNEDKELETDKNALNSLNYEQTAGESLNTIINPLVVAQPSPPGNPEVGVVKEIEGNYENGSTSMKQVAQHSTDPTPAGDAEIGEVNETEKIIDTNAPALTPVAQQSTDPTPPGDDEIGGVKETEKIIDTNAPALTPVAQQSTDPSPLGDDDVGMAHKDTEQVDQNATTFMKPVAQQTTDPSPLEQSHTDDIVETENADENATSSSEVFSADNPALLQQAQKLYYVIMIAIINYTDRSEAMNLAVNDAGLVPVFVAAVEGLRNCTASNVQYMIKTTGGLRKKTQRGMMLSTALGILHNLSKHVATRANFHACNAVSIILPLTEDKIPLYATKALLLLAYLIDEENNQLIMANDGPIKYLISLINKATQKSNRRYFGFSNSELAEGLAQIAINDSNKKKIVANGAIPILTNMIEAAKTDEEKIKAAEALWVLAFDEENKQEIKGFSSCMKALEVLRKSDNNQVKKTANGVLWEIDRNKQDSFPASSELKSDSVIANHVMISYQWDVQSTMIRVKDRLQAAGFRVWMDLEQMGGSTLEAMAKAVEDSVVVLVCVSQKYKESSNCRSEAEYAFQLKKDIVPLMMESNYRPDGWLGMIMGSKLWIDFSQGLKKLDSSCKDLEKELGVRGKGELKIVPIADINVVTVVTAAPKVDISGWTHQDVVNWMERFGLVLNREHASTKKLNGSTLNLLATLRNEVSMEFFYTSLKDSLGFSDIFDVMLFSNELKELVG